MPRRLQRGMALTILCSKVALAEIALCLARLRRIGATGDGLRGKHAVRLARKNNPVSGVVLRV